MSKRGGQQAGDGLLRLEPRLRGRVEFDAPLGRRTTYRVGGAVSAQVEVESLEDLRVVTEVASSEGLPILPVGAGSNMLVADRGVRAIALTLGRSFLDLNFEGDTVVVGGAVPLPVLARKTAAYGLEGLEWAVGIPGTVGGAVRMNAGGHGSDIASVCLRVHVFDLREREHLVVPAEELDFGYRSSRVGPDWVVLRAELRAMHGDPVKARQRIEEIVKWRREHQPGGQNTGSVFVNPPGDAAGRLIDLAGCKGMRVGKAEVSRKHANFIVVEADGAAAHVHELMARVRARVAERFGVWLEPETRLVGFESHELDEVGCRPEDRV